MAAVVEDTLASVRGYRAIWTEADVDSVMPEAYDAAMSKYYVASFGVTPEEAI